MTTANNDKDGVVDVQDDDDDDYNDDGGFI